MNNKGFMCLRIWRLIAVASLATNLLAVHGKATLVTFPTLGEFSLAVPSVEFESFEQVDLLEFDLHSPVDIGAFTISSDARFGVVASGPTMGQHPTDGLRYFVSNFSSVSRALVFTFEQPIMALSMDFIDFGDLPLFLGQILSMTTSAGDMIVIKIADVDFPSGNEFFFGFISDIPLTDVTFHTTAADTIAIDAMRHSALPEPSVGCLWCGAMMLICRRRSLRSAVGLVSSCRDSGRFQARS
jgi:hypothetical protein